MISPSPHSCPNVILICACRGKKQRETEKNTGKGGREEERRWGQGRKKRVENIEEAEEAEEEEVDQLLMLS